MKPLRRLNANAARRFFFLRGSGFAPRPPRSAETQSREKHSSLGPNDASLRSALRPSEGNSSLGIRGFSQQGSSGRFLEHPIPAPFSSPPSQSAALLPVGRNKACQSILIFPVELRLAAPQQIFSATATPAFKKPPKFLGKVFVLAEQRGRRGLKPILWHGSRRKGSTLPTPSAK